MSSLIKLRIQKTVLILFLYYACISVEQVQTIAIQKEQSHRLNFQSQVILCGRIFLIYLKYKITK